MMMLSRKLGNNIRTKTDLNIKEKFIMTKEEILEKSREENKNKDIATIEAEKKAGSFALITCSIAAAILWFIEVFITKEVNHSLWLVVLIANAAMHFHLFFTMKKKRNLICAILFTISSIAVLFITISVFMYKSIL